jgi:hypothetical protein
MDVGPHLMPKLVFHSAPFDGQRHLLDNKLNIYNPENVHHSLSPPNKHGEGCFRI